MFLFFGSAFVLAQNESDLQKKFNYFFTQAVKKRHQLKFDEAVEYLQRCKEIQPQTSTIYYELHVINLICRNEIAAFDYLQKAAELDSQNVFYKEILLPYYISSKQHEKAIDVCLFLIEKKPQQESYFYTLINLFEETKQFSEALIQLEKLEKRNGVEEYISLEKIKFLSKLNQNKKVEQEIKKLISAFPSQTDFTTLLGKFYLEEGKPKKAFKIYTSLLKKYPNNALLMTSLADYYRKNNNLQMADSLILEVLNNEYIDLEVKLGVVEESILRLKSDQRKENLAEKAFDILLSKYGESEMTQLFYFSYLLSQNQNEKALSVAESILQENPLTYEELWARRIELSVNKEPQELLRIIEEAVSYFPHNARFHYAKAMQLSFFDRDAEALDAIFLAILYENPNDTEWMSVLWGIAGDFLSSFDSKEDAESAYENALSFNPNNLSVLNNYAYFLAKQNRELKKAERMSAKTIEAEPANAIFLDTYAWIFFMKGELSSARFYIERAIAQDGGKNGEIFLHYGDILSAVGEKESALKAWEKAQELGENIELKLKIENNQK